MAAQVVQRDVCVSWRLKSAVKWTVLSLNYYLKFYFKFFEDISYFS